jgi:hypothetical protein
VGGELGDRQPLGAFGLEPLDEAPGLKVTDQGGDIGIVEGEDLCLQPPGPVLDDPETIGLAPKTGEQDPPERVDLTEQIVGEESRLDASRPCHLNCPLSG